ncbi:unnamed protein product [Caenorhabditis auriculariae]|uniref:Mos1 transposase HTH domain-containing protein n=1 Tax=Caenorhabditis auriculariae TaxID=2777116 RepID=A0A8S1H7U0_9PELO|nr:unnamed protein product [Caenorhabditis auriculariae]
MDQGRIRTFVYYKLLLSNDTGTTVVNICSACKKDVVSQRSVRLWFNRFGSGDTSLESREPSGRHFTVDDDEIRRYIKEKLEATTRELATTLVCSKSTIHDRLNLLGHHKVLAHWIRHRLTDAKKQSRVTVRQSLLLRNDARRTVWITREEEPPTTPKADLLSLKIILCCWWNSHRLRLHRSARETSRRHPGKASPTSLGPPSAQQRAPPRGEGDLAEVDDAWLGDVALSDYHFFRLMKPYLAGRKFTDYDHLTSDIADFFESQPAEFWAKGIGDLPNRCATVVDNCGAYIVD